MCAVELMDPKMDQCYRMSPASIDTEHLMHVQWPEVLTMEMVIKILQILIVYEAALADGASVLESTHQCILLWEGSWDSSPSLNLSERALLVYCKSLNVSLNRLCHGISEADIFEGATYCWSGTAFLAFACAVRLRVITKIALPLAPLPQPR